jgi:Fusaric acid resistance protein-like
LAAISAVVVSQEYLHETRSFLAGRIFGTLLGIGITVAVSQAASRAEVAVVVQMSIAVTICALIVRRFPTLRVAMWTCPIILLKTQVSEPIVLVALHRGSEVILGAIVGWMIHWVAEVVVDASAKRRHRKPIRITACHNRDVKLAILHCGGGGAAPHESCRATRHQTASAELVNPAAGEGIGGGIIHPPDARVTEGGTQLPDKHDKFWDRSIGQKADVQSRARDDVLDSNGKTRLARRNQADRPFLCRGDDERKLERLSAPRPRGRQHGSGYRARARSALSGQAGFRGSRCGAPRLSSGSRTDRARRSP